MNETPLETRRPQHLELLLRDYEQARDDERHALGIQINILGMAIAALAAMMAAAFAIGVEGGELGSSIALIGFYGVAPALLLLPAIAALWFARHAVIRGFYMRALERKIREQAGFGDSSNAEATPYSLVTLWVEVGSMSRRPVGVLFMGIVGLIYGIALIVLTLYCGYTLLQGGYHMVALCSSSVYLIVSLAMGRELVKTNMRGREFYRRSLDSYRPRLLDDLAPRPTGTSVRIARYLLFPRPHDFGKVIFCLFGAAVAAAPVGGRGATVLQLLLAAIGCAMWEFLLSQTRFILNDLLGQKEDAAAPAAAERRRIDADMANRIGIINAGFLCRTLLTAVVVVAAAVRLPHARWWILALVSIFAALTLVYEYLRHIEHDDKPAKWVQPSIRLTVALGYPLRVGAGVMSVVAAAGHDLPPTRFLPIILVAGWAFFCADLLIRVTWLQEGVSYLRRSEKALVKNKTIHCKPHINAVLDNFLKTNDREADSEEGGRPEGCCLSPLEAVAGDDGGVHLPTGVLLRVPTVWSAIVSGLFACGATVTIALGMPQQGSVWGPVVLLVCVSAAAFVTDLIVFTGLPGLRKTRSPCRRKPLWIIQSILLTTLALLTLCGNAGHGGRVWWLALAQILLHAVGTTAWIGMLAVPYRNTQNMTAFIVRFGVRAVNRLRWPGRSPKDAD